MWVKYAVQLLSNSVACGLNFYNKRVTALKDCEGAAYFTKIFNDAFDALNRCFEKEGITLGFNDFKSLRLCRFFTNGRST